MVALRFPSAEGLAQRETARSLFLDFIASFMAYQNDTFARPRPLFCLALTALLSSVLVTGVTGCVTKARAREQAREAYLAGRREAQRMQLASPTVTVTGPVRNGSVPWTAELTLAKAIIAAGYLGHAEPTGIVIVRNGEETRIDPARLLAGEDFPLDAGDVVKLEP